MYRQLHEESDKRDSVYALVNDVRPLLTRPPSQHIELLDLVQSFLDLGAVRASV
jgi:hypothetical protein